MVLVKYVGSDRGDGYRLSFVWVASNVSRIGDTHERLKSGVALKRFMNCREGRGLRRFRKTLRMLYLPGARPEAPDRSTQMNLNRETNSVQNETVVY